MDPDQTPPLSVTSDLGLHCLHMSHNKDARLIWANRGFDGSAETKRHLLIFCLKPNMHFVYLTKHVG